MAAITLPPSPSTAHASPGHEHLTKTTRLETGASARLRRLVPVALCARPVATSPPWLPAHLLDTCPLSACSAASRRVTLSQTVTHKRHATSATSEAHADRLGLTSRHGHGQLAIVVCGTHWGMDRGGADRMHMDMKPMGEHSHRSSLLRSYARALTPVAQRPHGSRDTQVVALGRRSMARRAAARSVTHTHTRHPSRPSPRHMRIGFSSRAGMHSDEWPSCTHIELYTSRERAFKPRGPRGACVRGRRIVRGVYSVESSESASELQEQCCSTL